jgi:hypothetical protein
MTIDSSLKPFVLNGTDIAFLLAQVGTSNNPLI